MSERERIAQIIFAQRYALYYWREANEAERDSYRFVADAILAAGFGDVAEAWDHGQQAVGDNYGYPCPEDNPYRRASA